ncbi:hypothetical protein AG1IA_06964 [Rhizoctonia solani AG-1 IA]|uniref:Uncharacterized protein n=1 Tax=Thanatephorus cucumeris (strain AG1-IA) TaxID=983506 RepID=L8WQF2_THACA|nr:hypothetical protein AG1IA_06964 [Rhizoctonia solani AG-1 IA]
MQQKAEVLVERKKAQEGGVTSNPNKCKERLVANMVIILEWWEMKFEHRTWTCI